MKPNSEVVALIPARGGSKGIPRKNIKQLAGKPLIAYAIQTALASNMIDRVVVSTEDEEIAATARQWGAEVPFMRPDSLAQDDSPEWLTWQHAIKELAVIDSSIPMKMFVCIPPTSPLRSVEDVDSCIQAFLGSDADVVITVKTADRSPYFNMVSLDESGYAQLALGNQKTIFRRQDTPVLYDMTTVAYVARPEFVLRANRMFDGRIKAVVVPAERAVDIDTEMDFAFAEYLLTERKPRHPQINYGTSREVKKEHGCNP